LGDKFAGSGGDELRCATFAYGFGRFDGARDILFEDLNAI
jgi:hypothetical protein